MKKKNIPVIVGQPEETNIVNVAGLNSNVLNIGEAIQSDARDKEITSESPLIDANLPYDHHRHDVFPDSPDEFAQIDAQVMRDQLGLNVDEINEVFREANAKSEHHGYYFQESGKHIRNIIMQVAIEKAVKKEHPKLYK